ncbi:MAG: 16S rRNA (cytosine(1402)-N(4))-methyltransferase RsmH, partial [Pseudomonadota bacterium]|nr:16S rRNA (cytosine(1402)-N(4))-methyltransferase RsmH [Pseudomonadota bacterium]
MTQPTTPSQTGSDTSHIPVLREQVLSLIAPCDGALIVDGTFGAGGYSRAALEMADCHVLGIDRDKTAINAAAPLLEKYPNRLELIEGCFSDVAASLASGSVKGVMLDLGVSSMQLDTPERGFSFRADGPLDMRMGEAEDSAADLVNTLSEEDLASIIRNYGEERFARRIARAIVRRRAKEPFVRTLDLAGTVRSVIPKSGERIDQATRTFQALRIAVNDELNEIDRALRQSERILAVGGVLAVVSFHSLEDRI